MEAQSNHAEGTSVTEDKEEEWNDLPKLIKRYYDEEYDDSDEDKESESENEKTKK